MFALFGGAGGVPCPQKRCLCSRSNLCSAAPRLSLLVGFCDTVYLCEPFLTSVNSKHTVLKILSGNEEECCKMLPQMNNTLKKTPKSSISVMKMQIKPIMQFYLCLAN